MPAVLRRLEEARERGLDVSADVYPWTAYSNGLDASLPAWVREGGREKLVARLQDPVTRARAKADFLKADTDDWSQAGPARVLITRVMEPTLRAFEGKTLEQIAQERGRDPVDALLDLVLADRGQTTRVTFAMSEEDVQAALRHPLVSICTDSPALAEDGPLAGERSHPRAWGSMPRILGSYVREQHVLSLEEAVRKMTSLPASRMALHDRGLLRPGMAADLAVFDPATVRERSTYADPSHYSEGVRFVVVNGQLIVDGGRLTDARPGRVLTRTGALRPGSTSPRSGGR
jgi:dihydroorotase/N-acyl-D-amino-acid deacylase